MGREACLIEDSSPSTSSRFISKPTSRKKTAIKPSLIQDAILYSKSTLSVLKPITLSSKAAKAGPRGELAIIKETTTQMIKIIPPEVSDFRKFLKLFRLIGFVMLQKYKYKATFIDLLAEKQAVLFNLIIYLYFPSHRILTINPFLPSWFLSGR